MPLPRPERETTPEEMLQTAEEIIPYFGIERVVEDMGGNAQAFIAGAAAFGLIMQDIETGKNTCECDVCSTMRQISKSVGI